MQQIKQELSSIFKKDFIHYLLEKEKHPVLKTISMSILPPLVIAFIIQVLISYDIISPLISVVYILVFLMVWCVYLFRIRAKLLRKRGNTSKELSHIVKWRNYLKARRMKLFTGQKVDVTLINEYLALFSIDVKKYNNRYRHRSTLVLVAIGLIAYFSRNFICNDIVEYIQKKELDVYGYLFLLTMGVAMSFLIVFLYIAGIQIYYSENKRNIAIYEKLSDLKITLIRKYEE